MPPLPLFFGSFNKTNTTVEDGSKVFASGKTRWFLSFFDTQTIVIFFKTEEGINTLINLCKQYGKSEKEIEGLMKNE